MAFHSMETVFLLGEHHNAVKDPLRTHKDVAHDMCTTPNAMSIFGNFVVGARFTIGLARRDSRTTYTISDSHLHKVLSEYGWSPTGLIEHANTSFLRALINCDQPQALSAIKISNKLGIPFELKQRLSKYMCVLDVPAKKGRKVSDTTSSKKRRSLASLVHDGLKDESSALHPAKRVALSGDDEMDTGDGETAEPQRVDLSTEMCANKGHSNYAHVSCFYIMSHRNNEDAMFELCPVAKNYFPGERHGIIHREYDIDQSFKSDERNICSLCRAISNYGILRQNKKERATVHSLKHIVKRFVSLYRLQCPANVTPWERANNTRRAYKIWQIGTMIRNTPFYYMFGRYIALIVLREYDNEIRRPVKRSDHHRIHSEENAGMMSKLMSDISGALEFEAKQWGIEVYLHQKMPVNIEVPYQIATAFITHPWAALNNTSVSMCYPKTSNMLQRFIDPAHGKFINALYNMVLELLDHLLKTTRKPPKFPLRDPRYLQSSLSVFTKRVTLTLGAVADGHQLFIQPHEIPIMRKHTASFIHVLEPDTYKDVSSYACSEDVLYFIFFQDNLPSDDVAPSDGEGDKKSTDSEDSSQSDVEIKKTYDGLLIDARACLLRSKLITGDVEIHVYPTVPRQDIFPEGQETYPPDLVAAQEPFLRMTRANIPDNKVFTQGTLPDGFRFSQSHMAYVKSNDLHIHIRNAHEISWTTLYTIWRNIKRQEQRNCGIVSDSFDKGEELKIKYVIKRIREDRISHSNELNKKMRYVKHARLSTKHHEPNLNITEDDIYNYKLQAQTGFYFILSRKIVFHLYGSISRAVAQSRSRWVLGQLPRKLSVGSAFANLVLDPLVMIHKDMRLLDATIHQTERQATIDDIKLVDCRLDTSAYPIHTSFQMIRLISKQIAKHRSR